MKKNLFLAMVLPMAIHAQYNGRVGINTDTPKATLDINRKELNTLPEGQSQGVIFPKFSTAERSTFSNPEVGTMIYNTDKNCIEIYRGVLSGVHQWSCLTDTGNTPPSGSNPPSSGGGTGGSTPPSSGGGTGNANMETTQTIYIPSIKDTGVDYQGVINNGEQKIRFTIPYTNGNNGAYNAVNTTVTSNAAAGENGDTNPLQLTIDSGTFSSSGGNITGTITVGGDGTLNVKKQALPTSASDFEAKKLNVATINFNLGTKAYSLKIVGVTGIPDRCFGKTTLACVGYGADEKEHEFIYIPIQGPDGRTWLNNNLGAEYARVGSSDFNPTQQATSKTDWKAYGSLFQWQRNPDGHELINWSGSTSGTPKYAGTGSISNSWTNAGTNKFIPYTGSPYSWVNSSLNSDSSQWNLWQTKGSTNPCPSGYHVPTHTEHMALHDAITGKSNGTSSSNSSAMWNETGLRLPASGLRRSYSGALSLQSSYGWLWSSEQDGSNYSWYLWFNSSYSNAGDSYYRANGFSVRCLKDN